MKNLLQKIALLTILGILAVPAAAKKPFEWEDLMKFESMRGVEISEDGKFVAFTMVPERGDPTYYVQSTEDTIKYVFERGSRGDITKNSAWAAIRLEPSAVDKANKEKDLKDNLAIINLATGEIDTIKEVGSYEFSNDAEWIAYFKSGGSRGGSGEKPSGSEMVLRYLETASELNFSDVSQFEFDSTSSYAAYTISESAGEKNGVYYIPLKSGLTVPQKIAAFEDGRFGDLSWNNQKNLLAFVGGELVKKEDEYFEDSCQVYLWNAAKKTLDTIVKLAEVPEGWYVPYKNDLKWTEDGERLFFGFKPLEDTTEVEPEFKYTDSTFFSIDTIEKHVELDIWHDDDPLIKPNRKVEWPSIRDRLFKAVYHVEQDRFVQLADLDMPDLSFTENPLFAAGYDDQPYQKEITWNGWFRDLYAVNLVDGSRELVAEKIYDQVSVSPLGGYIAYFFDKNWYLYDTKLKTTLNLTDEIEVEFWDVENDEPREPGSYGVGGWMENDGSILIYDRYDIWRFYPTGDAFSQTTGVGYIDTVRFRIRRVDRDQRYFKKSDELFLHAFDEKDKSQAIFKMGFDFYGDLDPLIDEDNYASVVAKAKEADKVVFTKELYDMFPDLWATDSSFAEPKRLTNFQERVDEYYWGTTRLVKWKNSAGDDLEGYVVLPENYDPGKKYPVMIYFYETMSDRMNVFVNAFVGHRPYFPVYIKDGYVVFLPDVKYRDGFPGESAVDCIGTGVDKLVELGMADPERVGLWGHSWSGYQATFMITQTDRYACAVAGAPVGNMTSAYSGIRLGSGLARQFQYEKWQSRIGGTIWDSLDNYLNNSPIFFADKVKTPLMIMFGDKDPAVPWEQGIEIYLAWRRLKKDIVFLQYRGEPHWPEKFPNKLDYAMKTKTYFDVYLLGRPKPTWITEGVPYKGK